MSIFDFRNPPEEELKKYFEKKKIRQLKIQAIKHPDQEQRAYAIYFLGEIGNKKAADTLLWSLENGSHPLQRIKAAEALGKLGWEGGIFPLKERLFTDFAVRLQARNALLELGWSPINLKEEVLFTLTSNTTAIPELVKKGKEELASSKKEIVPLLIDALKSPNKDIVQAAAATLGEIGDPIALPSLVSCLGHIDLWVNVRVIEALGNFKDSISVNTLLPLLENEEIFISSAAKVSLVEIGSNQVLEIMMNRVLNRNDSVALDVIMKMNRSDVVSHLFQLLENSEIHHMLKSNILRFLGDQELNLSIEQELLLRSLGNHPKLNQLVHKILRK